MEALIPIQLSDEDLARQANAGDAGAREMVEGRFWRLLHVAQLSSNRKLVSSRVQQWRSFLLPGGEKMCVSWTAALG